MPNIPSGAGVPEWNLTDLNIAYKKKVQKPPVDPANPCGILSHVADGLQVQTGVGIITCYGCLMNIQVPGHYQKFRPPLHKLQSKAEIRFKKDSKLSADLMPEPAEDFSDEEDMDEQ